MGVTYKIIGTRKYIWIFNADGCIFETQGKHDTQPKSIFGHIAKTQKKHLGDANFPYRSMTFPRIANI